MIETISYDADKVDLGSLAAFIELNFCEFEDWCASEEVAEDTLYLIKDMAGMTNEKHF